MLTRTDRVALAVADADAAASSINDVFDSVVVDDQRDSATNARRVTLQWGRDHLELMEPLGDGAVSRFLAEGKRGAFAGGYSSADPGAVAERLRRAGVAVSEEGDRFTVFPHDLSGTGVILSPESSHERVGLNDKLWQITYVVPDMEAAISRYSALFGIEDVFTSRYDSDVWGYHAAVTWFDARDGGLLDSLEYLEPFEADKAAGRFLSRSNGIGGIYMVSIETDDIAALRDRVSDTGGGWESAPGNEHIGFIHPRRTAGLLMGVVTYERYAAGRALPPTEG